MNSKRQAISSGQSMSLPLSLPGIPIRYGVGDSPFGPLFVATIGPEICALDLLDDDEPTPGIARLVRDRPGAVIERDDAMVPGIVARVVAHVEQGRPVDDLRFDLRGTPFQHRVWEGLRQIPRGTTTTYGALALRLGWPAGASRAVGTACGSNPVSILIPCHRVVRAGGGLGGYAWGLDRKRDLLTREGAPLP